MKLDIERTIFLFNVCVKGNMAKIKYVKSSPYKLIYVLMFTQFNHIPRSIGLVFIGKR